MATHSGFGFAVREINVQKGRGLVANQSYQEDDVILEETPVVCSQFSWNKLYKYKACDFCLRSMETAEDMARRLTNNPALVLPHPECCVVKTADHVSCPQCQEIYCCMECRSRAWEGYHKVLCLGQSEHDPDHPLNKLEEIWRQRDIKPKYIRRKREITWNIHYPPETACIMLIARILAHLKMSTDKYSALMQFKNFAKATKNEEEEIAHKMLGSQFVDQLEVLQRASTEALFSEDIHQWFTKEGFLSLFALIGTNGQGIGTSCLSAWVKNCDSLVLSDGERQQLDAFIDQLYVDLEQVSGSFLNCEGSGLYKLQSSCNHSCVPNAEITFPRNDHTLVLVALKSIQPDEEICISYIDECARSRSRHSRQKFLRENYLFTCRCEKCLAEADEPDCTSSEEDMEDSEGEGQAP